MDAYGRRLWWRMAQVVVAVCVLGGAAIADPLEYTFRDTTVWPLPLGAALTIEIPVVLVEAAVYSMVLRIRARQALWTSSAANCASYLAGVILLRFATPRSVLVGFGIVLAVEVPLVVTLNSRYPNRWRLLAVAVLVNVATFWTLVGLSLM